MKLLIKNRGGELTVECDGRLKTLAPDQELVLEVTARSEDKVAAELHFEEHNGKRYLTLWPAHGAVKA